MFHADYNKDYVSYVVKMFKNKPLTNFKKGGARLLHRRWIHLWELVQLNS